MEQTNFDMKTSNSRHGSSYTVEVFMHVLAWLFVFASPLIFNHGQTHINFKDYVRGCFMPLMMFVVFYTNYFVLVPKLFMHNRRQLFFVVEVILIAATVICIQEVFANFMPAPNLKPHELKKVPAHWLFVTRDIVAMSIVAIFGFATRLSRSWHKAENARREAELGKRNAELKNLRNQISPHFLLNTLNNIYALTMFDTEKAQKAIQELSRLLRYLLYDNQSQLIPLSKEVDFLKSYINLMRMRTAANVEIDVKIDGDINERLKIAPLLFMSLVENAFKHGINASEKSFINISLSSTSDGVVDFFCENSNFPKNTKELSPGGIGLPNLAQRLESIYPQHYHWQKGTSEDGKKYISHLVIQTQNDNEHNMRHN